MIAAAFLYDLQASKIVASGSFLRGETEQDLIKAVVEKYYELIQSESVSGCISFSMKDRGVCLCPSGENTILIGVGDSPAVTPDDLGKMRMLEAAFKRRASESSPREARGSFPKLVDGCIRKTVSVCFVTPEIPEAANRLATSVASLIQRLSTPEHFLRPISVGPFVIRVTRLGENDVPAANWSSDLKSVDGFCVIVGQPLLSKASYGKLFERIRRNSSAPIAVVPGSEYQSEMASQFATEFRVTLCESVSEKPSLLFLSLMRAFGLTGMQADLALETWLVDTGIDESPRVKVQKTKALGHQAFFVIDKKDGTPVYTLYYEPKSKVLERAPNVVAAISMFHLDPKSPNKTSVFQAGDLQYVMIEREELIFTLITGDKEDVESIRSRFSFLPDLYFDEAPEQGFNPNDFYTTPAFTIKLLATLPPEHLGSRMSPYKVQEPDWATFRDQPVGDFLKAVWDNLDGKKTMSQLVGKGGPVMVLGAVHLLMKMGAIKVKPVLASRDIPLLVAQPGEDLYGLYSHLSEIVKMVDGKRSIEEIGRTTGIATSVLLTVFSELHRRWIVGFDNDVGASPKPP